MAFQDRIAVDMLLAEQGGVCAMFGDQCCTFIPNNTSPDGSLTQAISGLQTLNRNMKKHSGVSESAWDSWWQKSFGKYKNLAQSVAMSVGLFATILTLCGCCIIPCLRSLISRLITTAIAPTNSKLHELYPLLIKQSEGSSEFQEHGNCEDELGENDSVFCFSDQPCQ
ncbi:syncytin-A-like [Stigmatopora argus]